MFFFFSSRRRHTRYIGDWSSDVCSSDLYPEYKAASAGADRSKLPEVGATPNVKLPAFERMTLSNGDRKSTRLNSSHRCISYAVFCLKKKKTKNKQLTNAKERETGTPQVT